MSTSSLILLIVLLVLGLIAVFIVVPLITRLVMGVEIISLLTEALGDYFERPGLVRIGCGVIILMLVTGCCMLIVLALAGVSCFTGSPSTICQVIGR